VTCIQANHFLSAHELFPEIRIQQMRSPLQGDHRIRNFSCFDHSFACLCSTDLSESLPISKYACGPCSPGSITQGSEAKFLEARWADANEKRDWRIYATSVCVESERQKLYARSEECRIASHQAVTLSIPPRIDLCLCAFFRGLLFGQQKGTIKLHTRWILRASILA